MKGLGELKPSLTDDGHQQPYPPAVAMNPAIPMNETPKHKGEVNSGQWQIHSNQVRSWGENLAHFYECRAKFLQCHPDQMPTLPMVLMLIIKEVWFNLFLRRLFSQSIYQFAGSNV